MHTNVGRCSSPPIGSDRTGGSGLGVLQTKLEPETQLKGKIWNQNRTQERERVP